MSDSTRPVTGFHARTDAEKLRRIAALCDDVTSDEFGFTPEEEAGAERIAYEVRAVLAEPGPAVPAHDVDRDALMHLLRGWMPVSMRPFIPSLCDQILALVRPVAGVVLSREEAADMASTLRSEAAIASRPGQYVRLEAVAGRLEASS